MLPTLAQVKIMFQRLLAVINPKFESKADKTELQKYIREIKETESGIEFIDGNGKIIYKIPTMK